VNIGEGLINGDLSKFMSIDLSGEDCEKQQLDNVDEAWRGIRSHHLWIHVQDT